MTVHAPGRHARLVDPDGLASLRLAIAVARDPQMPGAYDVIAFRAASRSRTDTRTESDTQPTIPVQSPPSEPTGELASVMDIVTRAQAGEAEAFGLLYDRYVDVVYRYIYYRVANATLAEDLTSETFLRALRRISSYTWQGRDFEAWLVTIARNLIADHFKSGRYRMEVATSDLVEAGADRGQDGPEHEA